jgi:hypothetical protein
MVQPSSIILLRARERTARNELLASELRQASGCEVRFLLDERSGERDPGTDVLSLNHQSYAALGLYTPPDAAWRCGDYGLYMAWREEPTRPYYWLIEDDVRIAGDVAEFFNLCTASNADLLCANLHGRSGGSSGGRIRNQATRWRWDACSVRFACRRRRSRQPMPSARAQPAVVSQGLWPNDEGLVATTVVKSGLSAADYNDVAPDLWTSETYSITGGPHTDVPTTGPPRLYHPVRFESRPSAHLKQTGWEDASALSFRLKQRAVRAYAARRPW